jgi:hypothetical protein
MNNLISAGDHDGYNKKSLFFWLTIVVEYLCSCLDHDLDHTIATQRDPSRKKNRAAESAAWVGAIPTIVYFLMQQLSVWVRPSYS